MSLSHGRAPTGLSLETNVAVTGGGGSGSNGTVQVNVPDVINLIVPEGGLGDIALTVDTSNAGSLQLDASQVQVSGSLSVDATNVTVALAHDTNTNATGATVALVNTNSVALALANDAQVDLNVPDTVKVALESGGSVALANPNNLTLEVEVPVNVDKIPLDLPRDGNDGSLLSLPVTVTIDPITVNVEGATSSTPDANDIYTVHVPGKLRVETIGVKADHAIADDQGVAITTGYDNLWESIQTLASKPDVDSAMATTIGIQHKPINLFQYVSAFGTLAKYSETPDPDSNQPPAGQPAGARPTTDLWSAIATLSNTQQWFALNIGEPNQMQTATNGTLPFSDAYSDIWTSIKALSNRELVPADIGVKADYTIPNSDFTTLWESIQTLVAGFTTLGETFGAIGVVNIGGNDVVFNQVGTEGEYATVWAALRTLYSTIKDTFDYEDVNGTVYNTSLANVIGNPFAEGLTMGDDEDFGNLWRSIAYLKYRMSLTVLQTADGNVTVSGDLDVSKDVTITENLTIGGNVGIGTTSPQSFLHVAGNTYLDGDVTIAAPASINDSSVTNAITIDVSTGHAPAKTGIGWHNTSVPIPYDMGAIRMEVGAGHDNTKMCFYTSVDKAASTEKMRIAGGGDIGIGTSDPQSLLHLRRGFADCILRLEADVGDTSDHKAVIQFVTDNGQPHSAIEQGNDRLRIMNAANNATGGAGSGIAFCTTSTTTNQYSDATERMKIDGNGNVTMTENLTVSGDVTITGTLANDSIGVKTNYPNLTTDYPGEAYGNLWESINTHRDAIVAIGSAVTQYLPARMYNFGWSYNVNVTSPGALFTRWMISATDDTPGGGGDYGSPGYLSQIATLASIGLLGPGVKALDHGNTSYPPSETTLVNAEYDFGDSTIGAHCTESYKILVAGYYRFTCSMAFISTTYQTNIIIQFAKKLYSTTDWIRCGPKGKSATNLHWTNETSSHINDITWCDVGDNVGVWTMEEYRSGNVYAPISTSSFTAELLSVMSSHAINDTGAWPGPNPAP